MLCLCCLTFEVSGRRRQDARPVRCSINHSSARAWWPAGGAPLDRGVRPHSCYAPAELHSVVLPRRQQSSHRPHTSAHLGGRCRGARPYTSIRNASPPRSSMQEHKPGVHDEVAPRSSADTCEQPNGSFARTKLGELPMPCTWRPRLAFGPDRRVASPSFQLRMEPSRVTGPALLGGRRLVPPSGARWCARL